MTWKGHRWVPMLDVSGLLLSPVLANADGQ